jgi:hypothetical protein
MDPDEYVERETSRLIRQFARKARRELRVQHAMSVDQSRLQARIGQQQRANNDLVDAINRVIQDTRRRAEFAHQHRKKTKLLAVEIQGLHGELAGLQQKEENEFRDEVLPPPKRYTPIQTAPVRRVPVRRQPRQSGREIEALAEQQDLYEHRMDEAQRELMALAAAADEVAKKGALLTAENAEVRRDLVGFNDIKQYFLTINRPPMGSVAASPKTAKPRQTAHKP